MRGEDMQGDPGMPPLGVKELGGQEEACVYLRTGSKGSKCRINPMCDVRACQIACFARRKADALLCIMRSAGDR